MVDPASVEPAKLVAVTPDADFAALLRETIAGQADIELVVHAGPLEALEAELALEDATLFLVDLDHGGEATLAALQRLSPRLTGLTCLAVTRQFDEACGRALLQARITDFLIKPVSDAELADACARTLRAAPMQEGGREADILTFLPASGGVGCTTLAVHAALLLQGEGGRRRSSTCLVDLDFQQGVCAEYLDLEPRLDITEIEPRPERLDRQLLEVMLSRHRSGLSVVAAPGRPGESVHVEPQAVGRLLDLVAANFDHVVIDLPRTWSSWTDSVLLGSNRLFIVAGMTVPALRQAHRLASVIHERLPEGPKPGIVVNRFEQRAFGPGLARSDVEQALGGFLSGTVANSYGLVREAIDQGVSVLDLKPNCRLVEDIRRVVRPAAGTGRSGLSLFPLARRMLAR